MLAADLEAVIGKSTSEERKVRARTLQHKNIEAVAGGLCCLPDRQLWCVKTDGKADLTCRSFTHVIKTK